MTLWKHPDFLKLWLGQAVSEVGSRITRDGLPLAAVLVLGASPLTMSGLRLASYLPVSLLGLLIGVWVDRLARRPLLIAADVARALVLSTIPVAAWYGVLHIWLLYVVAGITGVLTLTFDVSYQAYLPWLIDRRHLVEGNSKLGITASAAEIIGPGLTGVLVQALTAPIAIAFDALSYVVSAVSVWRIGAREGGERQRTRIPLTHGADDQGLSAAIASSAVLRDWRQEVLGGFALLKANRLLRALAGATITLGFAGSMMSVLYTLYAIRTLGMPAWLYGLTVTIGGVGALIGAALSGRLVRRFGLGRVIIGMLFLYGLSSFLIPLASGSLWRATVFMMAALLGDTTGMIYEILDSTIRQTVTSDAVIGRLNATVRVLEVGLTAVGSVIAGFLAETVGIRPTLVIAAAGMVLATAWLIFSPIRTTKTLPETTEGLPV